MIRLSVVVPFYDVERFAPETLASLARNVHDAVELVLVDDASTDATPQLLADAAARLPRTRVVRLPANRGLAAARNVGLDAATGRYLTFLDGDDAYAPGYLPTLLQTIERLGCDFVRTDHVRVTGRQREVRRLVHGPRGQVCPARSGVGSPDHASAVDSPYAWAGVYDRTRLTDDLLRFDEDLRTCEDRPWAWRLHLEAATFAVVGLHGVRYRRAVTGSLSQRRDAHQLDFFVAIDRILARCAADPDAQHLTPKAVRSACALLCWHLEHLQLYAAPLAEELWNRAVDLVQRLPPADLAATTHAFDEKRASTLRRVAGAAA